MKIKRSSNRSFGVVFSIFFLLIAFWPLLNEGQIRIWSMVLSIIFIILGLINSKLLTPLNILWFKFGMLLGRFIAPIVMFVIYSVAVVPTGLLMRLFNKDLLNKKIDKKVKTYWIKREKPVGSMKNQF